ncbi:MAG: GNAT family N-acetyltransferase [Promethearchaeota archaeon]
MTFEYQLRPATMADKEFMMHLEKVNFQNYPKLMEQFDEEHQKYHYENYFKPKHVSIIEHANLPIGAQSLIVRRKNMFIVYLYLLPEFQNKGIDESLIKIALKRAKKEKKPVLTCMFKEDKQGMSMCHDLGFEIFAEDDLHWRVKWDPD